MSNRRREAVIRCEWGEEGLRALLPGSDAVVIVDVLSFSTCVDVATSRGASVRPATWASEEAGALARSLGALLAGPRAAGGYSLSPASLLSLPAGVELVLASPNGAALSLATGGVPAYAACLRNAAAVAAAVRARGGPRCSIIAAGERWPGGALRPALEDWLGAGAVIAHLSGRCSPEAESARASFLAARDRLPELLLGSTSGAELAARGYAGDVEIAAAFGASSTVPSLVEGAYRDLRRV